MEAGPDKAIAWRETRSLEPKLKSLYVRNISCSCFTLAGVDVETQGARPSCRAFVYVVTARSCLTIRGLRSGSASNVAEKHG